jgi:N-acetylglutamate synthase-like GNAT family acetyltransferase
MIMEFASPADEARLQEIFTAADMDMAGEAEEHVVVRRDGKGVAGGRLYQAEEDLFHLLVFAVAAEERGRGNRPRYCWRRWLSAVGVLFGADGRRSYRITDEWAQRGGGGFFKRVGFTSATAAAAAPFGGS